MARLGRAAADRNPPTSGGGGCQLKEPLNYSANISASCPERHCLSGRCASGRPFNGRSGFVLFVICGRPCSARPRQQAALFFRAGQDVSGRKPIHSGTACWRKSMSRHTQMPETAASSSHRSTVGSAPEAGGRECSGPCIEDEANAAKSRAALSSVIWSALLTVLKLVAGISTNSLGMLSA